MPEKNQNLKAVLMAVTGFSLFSLNDAVIKLLAQNYSIPQTLFWTSVFVCLALLVYARMNNGRKMLQTPKPMWHMLRGVFMMLMIFCNIFARSHLNSFQSWRGIYF